MLDSKSTPLGQECQAFGIAPLPTLVQECKKRMDSSAGGPLDQVACASTSELT